MSERSVRGVLAGARALVFRQASIVILLKSLCNMMRQEPEHTPPPLHKGHQLHQKETVQPGPEVFELGQERCKCDLQGQAAQDDQLPIPASAASPTHPGILQVAPHLASHKQALPPSPHRLNISVCRLRTPPVVPPGSSTCCCCSCSPLLAALPAAHCPLSCFCKRCSSAATLHVARVRGLLGCVYSGSSADAAACSEEGGRQSSA